MSEKKTSWILELVDKITAPLRGVQSGADKTAAAFENANKNAEKFGTALKKVRAMDWAAVSMSIDKIDAAIRGVTEVGANYDAALRNVSAITGITGKELKGLGNEARDLAEQFGTTAADNLGLFQTALSRLGPQIGKDKEALGDMGVYANTLAL